MKQISMGILVKVTELIGRFDVSERSLEGQMAVDFAKEWKYGNGCVECLISKERGSQDDISDRRQENKGGLYIV